MATVPSAPAGGCSSPDAALGLHGDPCVGDAVERRKRGCATRENSQSPATVTGTSTSLPLLTQCVRSGLLAPPCFGDGKFSRVRQLHIWLKRYCSSRDILSVDSLTSFLNRPELFKSDGLYNGRSYPNETLKTFYMRLFLVH